MAVVQVGGPIHYTLALIEKKWPRSQHRPAGRAADRLQPSLAVPAARPMRIIPVTAVGGSIARGDMKNLGFTGDEVR